MIQATSAGLTAVTTNALTIIPAAAAQLVVTGQPPANISVGSRFTLSAAIEDRFGNIVTTANSARLSVALAVNPVNATLAGTLTVTVRQGIATFSNLSLNKTGQNFVIGVTASGLTGVKTNVFNVIAAMNESREGGREERQEGDQENRAHRDPAAVLVRGFPFG